MDSRDIRHDIKNSISSQRYATPRDFAVNNVTLRKWRHPTKGVLNYDNEGSNGPCALFGNSDSPQRRLSNRLEPFSHVFRLAVKCGVGSGYVFESKHFTRYICVLSINISTNIPMIDECTLYINRYVMFLKLKDACGCQRLGIMLCCLLQ